jgi:hypothetical protein
MMTIGDIRAATTVIRSIREDWAYDAIEAGISTLADGNYSHADILHACITIAQDQRNMAPVTLAMKAPDLIARAHATTHRRPVYRPGRNDPAMICDVCLRTRDVCEASAGNRGSNWDHVFVSVRDADIRDGRVLVPPGLFAMPEDV